MRRVLTNRYKIHSVVVVWLAALLLHPTVSVGQAQTILSPSDAAASDAWRSIAEKVALLAKKAGCDGKNCKILVADCITTETSSSLYGRRISNEFSDALANVVGHAHVVNRSLLKEFLDEKKIPSHYLSDGRGAGWLGKKLGATFVVSPSLISYSVGPQVIFRITRVDSELVVTPEAIRIPLAPPSTADLQPSEEFAALQVVPPTRNSELDFNRLVIGHQGNLPKCYYSPQPAYTEDARILKINGSVVAEAIVTQDGAVKDLIILKGLPCGLSESMIAALKTWRCKPALIDGKPVAVRTQFEVTYRLY
jgi:hypothetical protein